MSDDASGVEAIFFRELSRLLDPITAAATDAADGDEMALLELLSDMGAGQAALGEKYDPIKSSITEIASSYETIETEVVEPLSNGQIPNLSKADEIFEAFGDIFQTLKGLDDLDLSGADVDFEAFGERVVDYLLITYLEDFHPQAHAILTVVGVITKPSPEDVGDIDLSAIGTVLDNPNQLMADVFDWGLEEFTPYLLLYYVRELLWELSVPASLEAPDADVQQQIQGKTPEETPAIEEQQLRVRVLTLTTDGAESEAGIMLIPLPAANGSLPGLAVMPYGTVEGKISQEISEQWTFNAQLSAAAGWVMKIRPEQNSGKPLPELDSVSGEPNTEVHGKAGVSFDGSTGEQSETTLLGSPEASRVAVKTISVAASVDYDGETVVFTVSLPATGTIGVHPSDFDGFLSKVMPGDGIFYDFDVEVGWSSESGLYFERGGTLEVALPQRASLGPLSMEEIWLAAGPDGAGSGSAGGGGGSGGSGASGGGSSGGGSGGSSGGGGGGGSGGGSGVDASGSASGDVSVEEGTVTIAAAASGTVELGPVKATVKRMGVEGEISFPDEGGNLGPAQLDMAFKPPEGVGISIEAGAVSGGGYLEFDYENERYAGVLQIKAGSLTINAVGLLTTELPGGKDGFSLLLIISGEFSPVQLGFGFTLNGVGGIVGVNRSMKRKPLGKAARTGSMDSVLFPQNPVANSQRIISDLRAIFPPNEGTHVFGPMARLGWGTPTLITADLAVVLEVPTWKIALLGRLSTLLPDEKAPLIELNLSVAGFLDPPNKQVAIDASLYDSRIVMWTVSGDMAMRSNYGDDPRFLLSVGGWNPRYDPPKNFPDLRRVKASLGAPGGNPKIEFTGYFAVTSNTVQAGAGVHALAKAGPAKIEGKLSIDALIQFSPFKFVVDFYASFSVTIKGTGLSIKIDGTLSGPGPFRIKGTLHIEILFFEITVNANVTIGPSKKKEKLPPARVLPKITEELNKPANWTAQLPASGTSWATFREVEAGEGEVLAHPMGEVGVRQTIAPLQYQLEKFGNATPSGYTRFEVTDVTVSGSAEIDFDATTKEDFAPAQFSKMSDSEKMNSPAFEKHPAGRKMRHTGIYCGYPDGKRDRNRRQTTFGYECSVIDRTKDNWGTDLAKLGRFAAEGLPAISGLTDDQLTALTAVGAVANSPARRAGNHRFRLSETDQAIIDAVDGGAVGTVTGADGEESVVRGGSDPDIGGLAGSISMEQTSYVIARASDLQQVDIPTADDEMTKSQAQRALSRYERRFPSAATQLRVVTAHRAKTDGTGGGGR